MRAGLAERLAALETMSNRDIRAEWEQAYKTPAPNLSSELLRLGVAWRLQEKQLGGHDRHTVRILRARDHVAAETVRRRKLTAGTRLVRDWHGEGHSVTVLEDGFDYDGRRWPSLTAIARHITGAKWSGPRFFGLTRATS